MLRRLFVAVLVAAMTLAVAPRPASGLGDDHYRCMYRCKERGDPFSQPRRNAAIRPLGHDCSCARGQGRRAQGGWGQGGRDRSDGWYHRPGGRDRWDGRNRWDRGDPWDRWDRRGWGGHRWDRWNRRDRGNDWDRWDRPGRRERDPSRDSGYDAHRHHPRGRDF